MEYVNHITFLTDIKIILKTVGKVFIKREGISSAASDTMEEFMGTENIVVENVRARS